MRAYLRRLESWADRHPFASWPMSFLLFSALTILGVVLCACVLGFATLGNWISGAAFGLMVGIYFTYRWMSDSYSKREEQLRDAFWAMTRREVDEAIQRERARFAGGEH